MSTKLIPCRVCGKPYPPCKNCADNKSAFHWRDVACSRECFAEYMKRVEEGRKQKVVVETTLPVVNETAVDTGASIETPDVPPEGGSGDSGDEKPKATTPRRTRAPRNSKTAEESDSSVG